MNAAELDALLSEAEARQQRIEANLAAVERLHARIDAHPWRPWRNWKLRGESQMLLEATRRALALNDALLARLVAGDG